MINSTVTEIYDMNTHINELGIIGIHTPRFDMLFKHLMGHFIQFKRWKYNGATISLIPAAMLPQDVSGVSIGAGDQSVDPRDVFNPILHKGFTGESLGAFLDQYLTRNSYRGDSLTYAFFNETDTDSEQPNYEQAYYQMLTQGGFKKMMPMGSIRNQRIYPLVYDMATTRQLAASWNGAFNQGTGNTVGLINEPRGEINYTIHNDPGAGALTPSALVDSDLRFDGENKSNPIMVGRDYYGGSGSTSFGYEDIPIMTPRKRKLGWMDTLQKVFPAEGTDTSEVSTSVSSEPYTFAQLPKLFEYLLVTPPSYFTKLYYRLIVRHSVSFAGQRSALGAGNALSTLQTNYYNFMEQLPESASVAESVETLGADVTKVIDGMQNV